MSQLVQNPLPRKGTETNEAAHLNRLGHGSKSITPQGDGNSFSYLDEGKVRFVQNPSPRKGTETKIASASSIPKTLKGSKSITPQGDGNKQ